MAEHGAASRPARLVWWWFLIQGGLAVVFGVLVFATPPDSVSGYLVDCAAYAALVLIEGILAMSQALVFRGAGAGWVMFLIIALHAVAASIVFGVLIALRMPTSFFWSSMGFLLLEGVLLVIGLMR